VKGGKKGLNCKGGGNGVEEERVKGKGERRGKEREGGKGRRKGSDGKGTYPPEKNPGAATGSSPNSC